MIVPVSRFAWSSVLAACVLLVANVAPAGEGRVETLRAVNDGHPLTITYYPVSEKSAERQNAPVVLLLHGGDNKGRILWDKAAPARGEKANFVQSLNDDGYAVITVDLRKFGDSKLPGDATSVRPDDYEKMSSSDMFAVKQFLFEKHQEKEFNMNKLAIVAAGPTAPVAINFAAADLLTAPYEDAPVLANRTPRGQDVRAIVLLSPDLAAGRLSGHKALNFIKVPAANIAALVVAGAQDTGDKDSKKIFEILDKAQKKDEKRVYMLSPKLRDRELGLIGKAPDQVEVPIRNFLNKHVKEYPSAWRDRRSKVTG